MFIILVSSHILFYIFNMDCVERATLRITELLKERDELIQKIQSQLEKQEQTNNEKYGDLQQQIETIKYFG